MINLFKTGDVVCVKGQSVKMTIGKVPEALGEKYECVWFDNENKLHTETFEESSLTNQLS